MVVYGLKNRIFGNYAKPELLGQGLRQGCGESQKTFCGDWHNAKNNWQNAAQTRAGPLLQNRG